MPRFTNLNKEDYNTVPDLRTVFQQHDWIYYIDVQSGQGRFGKMLKASPSFGPAAKKLLIHWMNTATSEDSFINVEDPSIRVRRQVAAQMPGGNEFCEGDDTPGMEQLTAPQAPRHRRATTDMDDFGDHVIHAVKDLASEPVAETNQDPFNFCNWEADVIDDAHKEAERPKRRLRRTLATAMGTTAATATTVAMATVEEVATAEAAMRAATPTVEVATATAVSAVEVVFDGGTSASQAAVASDGSDGDGDGCDGGGVDDEGGNTVRGGDTPVYN